MSPRNVHVWDKTAGLPVMPPHADPTGDCVLARLSEREPFRTEVPWPDGFDGGIVHRLDTSTSGALALARDLEDLEQLRALFRDRRLRKTYRLLVSRDPRWDENSCELPLAHDPRHKGRMVVRRGNDSPHRGKWMLAETAFRRIDGALFEAVITTGVMHQVRVHAAFLGIPIVGDRRYGGGPTPPDASPGLTFYLHHVGFTGPELRTDPVPTPEWAAGRS